ncbi:MAG: hypothetical protein D6678_04435 [Zetaproteobacteria bacterium]|nr:MAG: hypothetical protein D6678_04435 [Zetaproteobacteria bacterium]
MMVVRLILPFALLFLVPAAWAAGEEEFYGRQLQRAAAGDIAVAAAALAERARVLPRGDLWRTRMQMAAMLLRMRVERAVSLPARAPIDVPYRLAKGYVQAHPPPSKSSRWPVVLMAALLPGLGHAWLGRWQDVKAVALLVWPMIVLTLWAAKRRMGPVTVFFALITLWLWSGSVYSALSLHEREAMEQYLAWWQQLWLASALPGRPW